MITRALSLLRRLSSCYAVYLFDAPFCLFDALFIYLMRYLSMHNKALQSTIEHSTALKVPTMQVRSFVVKKCVLYCVVK